MSKILANIFEMVSDRTVDRPAKGISNDSNEDHLGLSSSKTAPPQSMIDDLKARKCIGHDDNASEKNSDDLAQILQQKYKKRGILISYDIKGSFQLRRVVCKTIEDLKSLGFQDDIWFDKDEGETTTNASFGQRLESAEECNAAIMFISQQFFNRSPTKYEADIFRQRQDEITSSGNQFRVFIVRYSPSVLPIPACFLNPDVDLTSRKLRYVSLAEKAAAIVGSLSEDLEGYVTFSTKLYRHLSPDFSDNFASRGYKEKPVFLWDIRDVQDWLGSLGVHERYRLSLEENEIDGFLLTSLNECDIQEYLNVDNKTARHKILHGINNVLDRETSWDMSCRNRKTRDNNVYLVCDPVDVWIAEFIIADLVKVGIMAQMHNGPGFSKSNARLLAEAATVVFLLTSSSESSHVVFKEILLAAWLEKPIVTAVFDQSAITSARCALQAIVAKQPAVNFGRERYLEGLDVLRYHVTRGRGVLPKVILQQHYVQKMRNGLKTLETLLQTDQGLDSEFKRPKVFLSYHWDMQSKVCKMKEYLDRNGCETTTDASRPMAISVARSRRDHATLSCQMTPALVQDGISNANIVVLCITLKYLHCDNFIKDTQLAELHKKSVVPVLIQWCPRPLDRVMVVAKRLDITSALIDMSNEQLFRKSLPKLLELIMKKCV